MTRYSITRAALPLTDFFDDNAYSHDPRTQFMGWGVMYNGAWDYPADTRGYTWGWVHEFHTRNWSLPLRQRSRAQESPTAAQFDRRCSRDRGDMFEGERRYSSRSIRARSRLLPYLQPRRCGQLRRGDPARARRPGRVPISQPRSQDGTLKYGFGMSVDQEIAKDFGVFGRLGWNDGKTESFAFTAIDRLATGGVSFDGRAGGQRKNDTVATRANG